jgi:hypothetical protein
MKYASMISVFLATALVGLGATAIADDDHDHDHGNYASGGSFLGLGVLWTFEAEGDDHHHYTVMALATNGFSTNGVLIEDHGHVEDSGIQLHDACVVPGFDIEHDLVEEYAEETGNPEPFYPFAYIIASPDEAGLNDAGAIAAAAWFWEEQGVSIFSHHALHDACEDLGGEFLHADLIIFQDEHEH